MLLFTLPRAAPVASGNSYAGAKLYFYVTTTSTAATVYSNPTLTTPITQPVVASAAGVFQEIYLDESVTYKVVWTTAGGSQLGEVDPINGPLTAADIGEALYPLSDAETSAGLVESDLTLWHPYFDVRRYGAIGDGTEDDTQSIEDAIDVAVQSAGGSDSSGQVIFPAGVFMVSSQITLPNKVVLKGVGRSSTTIRATGGHTGPWVFKAFNGTSSMFGSRLENLGIDCNDVSGLGGVWTAAWQENSGIKNCLIWKFRTSGIKFARTGAAEGGGMATCKLEEVELFGSTSGATYGIDLQAISAAGYFTLLLDNVMVAGGLGDSLTAGVNVVQDSVVVINCHFENCDNGFLIDLYGSHTYINCTGSSGSPVVDLVEVKATFVGALNMIGCKRAGTTNFVNNLVSGSVITGAVADPAQYVHPNVANATVPIFTASDTTPSVSGGDVWRTLNTAPTTITNLDNGSPGQIVTILFGDSVTTLSGANFSLRGAMVSLVTRTVQLIYSASVWYEVARTSPLNVRGGSGAPSAAAVYLGELYVKNDGKVYCAVALASTPASSDWALLN